MVRGKKITSDLENSRLSSPTPIYINCAKVVLILGYDELGKINQRRYTMAMQFVLIKCPAIYIWFNIRSMLFIHFNDVMMNATVSQITGVTIVYSIVCSGADQTKRQSSASLAFVWGIHRWPVNTPHIGPVTRKCFHLMTSSCRNAMKDTADLFKLFKVNHHILGSERCDGTHNTAMRMYAD